MPAAPASEPTPYVDVKELPREAYKGKQFATAAPRPLLDPIVKSLSEGEPWRERLPYRCDGRAGARGCCCCRRVPAAATA